MAILNPYINFNNGTKTAMEFYKTVFGGELTMTTYKDGGMSSGPEDADLIMHAQLTTTSGFTLMASDTPPKMLSDNPRHGMSISISGDEESELSGYWEKLAEGATITAPFEKSPWGDVFGMLTDKFGVDWMVNVVVKKQ